MRQAVTLVTGARVSAFGIGCLELFGMQLGSFWHLGLPHLYTGGEYFYCAVLERRFTLRPTYMALQEFGIRPILRLMHMHA